MDFGWINICGIIIVILMLIPNIIYAYINKNIENKYNNKIINIIEQIGRYLSIFLIIFPIGTLGFKSVLYMLIYLIGNSILLLLYLIIWIFYFKNKTLLKSIFLALIPTLIFFISGVTLNHLCLIIISLIFGYSHILITYKNNN